MRSEPSEVSSAGHSHIEVSAESRETAMKIGIILGRQAVEAMIDTLRRDLAVATPENQQHLRHDLEVWVQSGIMAGDTSHLTSQLQIVDPYPDDNIMA